MNGEVQIFVRAAYLRDLPSLRAAGAQHVFSGEGEVALSMPKPCSSVSAPRHRSDLRFRERQRVHEALLRFLRGAPCASRRHDGRLAAASGASCSC